MRRVRRASAESRPNDHPARTLTMLPSQHAWLANEPGPKMHVEALKEFGTLETPGTADNPKVLAWAAETGTSSAI
jgi:hypothetical protein